VALGGVDFGVGTEIYQVDVGDGDDDIDGVAGDGLVGRGRDDGNGGSSGKNSGDEAEGINQRRQGGQPIFHIFYGTIRE